MADNAQKTWTPGDVESSLVREESAAKMRDRLQLAALERRVAELERKLSVATGGR